MYDTQARHSCNWQKIWCRCVLDNQLDQPMVRARRPFRLCNPRVKINMALRITAMMVKWSMRRWSKPTEHHHKPQVALFLHIAD
jgi:hypothetical protein